MADPSLPMPLLLLLFGAAMASRTCEQSVYPPDAEALLAAKAELSDPQGALATWRPLIGSACCWRGISCNQNSTRVTSVDVTGLGLRGPLPPSLGTLTELMELRLSGNFFEGGLPPNWRQCTKLERLEINNNKLNGSLEVLGNLKRLQVLDVENNNFTGELHSLVLGNLGALKEINLGKNGFKGGFPGWLKELKNLSFVDFSENDLFPSKLPFSNESWPKNLQKVRFFAMNLVGPIPPMLCSLPLSMLDLSSNKLNGSIPDFNGKFENLTLNLSRNSLTGSILPLLKAPQISFSILDLSHNRLSGEILEFGEVLCNRSVVTKLGRISDESIALLDMSFNNLWGEVPSELGACSKLETVLLGSNNFTGTIPLDLFGSSMRTLDLSRNAISGLPNFTEPTSPLRTLKLRKNRISELPSSLKKLQHLEILDLGENLLTSVPSVILKLAWLQRLYVDSNNISGRLPAFIGNISFLQVLDLSNNQFIGTIPPTFGSKAFAFDEELQFYKFISFMALTYLNLSHCNLTGVIPPKLGNLQRLQTLDLSSNSLRGRIPDFQYTNLIVLNLSQNGLVGHVPSSLGRLPLQKLSLSRNRFSGYIPKEILSKKELALCNSFRPGNSNLKIDCIGGYVLNRAHHPSSSHEGLRLYVILLIVVGSLLIIFAIMVWIYVCFRPIFAEESYLSLKLRDHFVKRFRLQIIREATDNFSKLNLLGEGGYGVVYKGIAKDGQIWAVKRARKVSIQSLKLFQTEVDVISRMNHKHLVKLLGFCDEDNEQILIYEFVENGTLKAALRLKNGRPPLTFKQRLEVALGAAEGLAYLHSQAKPTIIHRDVKSDNILLDAQLKAKVADFGLLKDNGDEDKDSMSFKTRVAGTHGYVDPEYYTTYRVTPKSDVYSFGVVLLELMTGQSAVIAQPEEVDELTSLATWALRRIRSTLGLAAIVDPNLDGNYSLEDMQTLASIAASCLQKVSLYRLDMADVVSQLRALKAKVEGLQVPSLIPIFEENGNVMATGSCFTTKCSGSTMRACSTTDCMGLVQGPREGAAEKESSSRRGRFGSQHFGVSLSIWNGFKRRSTRGEGLSRSTLSC